ncbi:MAG: AMP-binding protein [Alphaproteobacteria bacterium]|jgi:acyl-CoA synthetase (AMP-forming)/AMP-acid ligase II|nr:AMP-binding protein [Alphaproteobacteria bacterium]
MRLIDFFERGLSYYPERACLIDGGGEYSYREVAMRSHRTANALLAGGLELEDTVAILSPNGAPAFEAWIGAARAGGAWVGLAALASIDENIYVINDRDAAWLFYHSSFEGEIARIKAECPKLKHVICLDRPGLSHPYFDDFIADFAALAPELPDCRDKVISHFTTGGTSGRPWGAIWSNLTWEAWCANLYAHMPVRKPPVFLVASSMSHAAGAFAWPALAFGGTIVCIPRAEPLAVLEAMHKYRVTHTFLPPTVIYMMLAHPKAREFDLSAMDYLVYGGAPMSADKVKQAIDLFGPCMAQMYGQAECPGTICLLSPADHLEALSAPDKEQRLTSCGRPPVFVRVEMMGDDGNLMAEGERGEIVVRGTLVSLGCYGDPEASAANRAHGWHHTGDIGYKDADGFVYIVDRKMDMIISGGLNVYPIEIERLIWSHPAVQDCAVIGVPDEKWGEAVKAVIELKSGQSVTAAEIIALCKATLSAYKAPKTVEIWDALPRSGVGKVLKRKVRERFWAGHDRKI